MWLKKYKPYTPSRRTMVGSDFADITTSTPLKSLTTFLGKTGGRNSQGRTTSRFRGGGHKQLYRIIDFRVYDKLGVPATVSTIEYDPYRTCRIALLNYADGEKRYTLAWNGIQVGQKVMCGPDGELVEGNRKQLKDIPDGFLIHNLEVTPNTKGKMCRSAGAYAVLQGRDADEVYTIVKLQSGQVRKIHSNCYATIGKVGNEEHMNTVIGKAGKIRWLGRKSRVLGKSMNPVDHPHGWGEWHTDIGLRKGPKAFNGRRVAPGIKTRSPKKPSSKFILSRRTKN